MIDSNDALSQTDLTKIFGQIGTMMSVAITNEHYNKPVEIKGPTLDEVFPTSVDRSKRKTYWFAKPFETFCQENMSFMLKHLNETAFQSGVHTLFSSDAMHDTHYKHSSIVIEKTNPVEGGEILHLKFDVAYMVQPSKKKM